MEMSNAAVGAIAALCVTAGGAGVHVATSNRTPATPIESAVMAVPVQAEPAVPAAPVTRGAPPRRPATARPPRVEPSRVTVSAPVIEQAESAPVPRSIWSPHLGAQAAPSESIVPVEIAPTFTELIVPADAVVGLQIETAVNSETAELEDEVVARVTRDVRVGDRVAIPSGAQAIGEVTLIERGGRLRERARLGVRFTSAVLSDGTRIPLMTDTIVREGSSPGGESAAKIGGGAIGGAIIGGIIGGARGAAIGGSVGAGAGTAAVMAGARNAATLTSGTPVSARLIEPTTVPIDY